MLEGDDLLEDLLQALEHLPHTALGRADRVGMNRTIWLAYAVFVVGLILIAAVLLGLLPV